MKKILLFVVMLACAGMINTSHSQCTVSNLSVEVNSITPNAGNGCTINFDLSWIQEINSGNKFAYVHLWRSTAYHTPAAAWPAGGTAIYSGPSRYPEAAQLVNALINIVIENNNTATPSIGATYYPDPTVTEFTATTVTKTAVNASQERMTLSNISLSFTDCNLPVILQGDIWASQAANGKNVHCASEGLSFVLNDPRVMGFKKCTSPRVFNLSITTSSTTNVNVYYKLYKDDGDGLFEPGTADALLTTSASFDISASSPFIGSDLGYPGNNAPGENSSLWVEVLKTSGGTFSTVAFLEAGACIPLPVDLKTFSAERNNSSVLLKWETMSEQNNAGFAIERYTGNGWQQVAFVYSQAPGGNSNSVLTYSHTDINAFKGVSQYRLKQIDLDSRFKYSVTRMVRGEGQGGKVTVFPNPSKDGKVNVVFDNNVARNISLVDMGGRIVRQWKGTTAGNIQIDNLVPGIYSLLIITPQSGEQTVEKIVVNQR
jgi:hypothetical protein